MLLEPQSLVKEASDDLYAADDILRDPRNQYYWTGIIVIIAEH